MCHNEVLYGRVLVFCYSQLSESLHFNQKRHVNEGKIISAAVAVEAGEPGEDWTVMGRWAQNRVNQLKEQAAARRNVGRSSSRYTAPFNQILS